MDFLFENEPELWARIVAAVAKNRPGESMREDLVGISVNDRVYAILYSEEPPSYVFPSYIHSVITEYLKEFYPEALI